MRCQIGQCCVRLFPRLSYETRPGCNVTWGLGTRWFVQSDMARDLTFSTAFCPRDFLQGPQMILGAMCDPPFGCVTKTLKVRSCFWLSEPESTLSWIFKSEIFACDSGLNLGAFTAEFCKFVSKTVDAKTETEKRCCLFFKLQNNRNHTWGSTEDGRKIMGDEEPERDLFWKCWKMWQLFDSGSRSTRKQCTRYRWNHTSKGDWPLGPLEQSSNWYSVRTTFKTSRSVTRSWSPCCQSDKDVDGVVNSRKRWRLTHDLWWMLTLDVTRMRLITDTMLTQIGRSFGILFDTKSGWENLLAKRETRLRIEI